MTKLYTRNVIASRARITRGLFDSGSHGCVMIYLVLFWGSDSDGVFLLLGGGGEARFDNSFLSPSGGLALSVSSHRLCHNYSLLGILSWLRALAIIKPFAYVT